MAAYAEYMDEQMAIEDWIEAGAPSPMEMWRRLRGEPDPANALPLSVKQAAKRENVSLKWIYRRLPLLTTMEPRGAWKMGRVWQIAPAALLALRDDAQAAVADTASPRRRPRTGGRPETRIT